MTSVRVAGLHTLELNDGFMCRSFLPHGTAALAALNATITGDIALTRFCESNNTV